MTVYAVATHIQGDQVCPAESYAILQSGIFRTGPYPPVFRTLEAAKAYELTLPLYMRTKIVQLDLHD